MIKKVQVVLILPIILMSDKGVDQILIVLFSKCRNNNFSELLRALKIFKLV